MKRLQRVIEAIVVNSRWLLAPFLLGLTVSLTALLYAFFIKLVELLRLVGSITSADVIVSILGLVDITLAANLIVIVIRSIYENFLARIDPTGYPQWPEGLSKISYSLLKQKLFGSLVAIAAVSALEWFFDIERHADSTKLAWVVGIMMAFAFVMLLTAVADRLSDTDHDSHA